MSFILKNAAAIYKKFVNKIFDDLIREKVEAYINNMVVKIT